MTEFREQPLQIDTRTEHYRRLTHRAAGSFGSVTIDSHLELASSDSIRTNEKRVAGLLMINQSKQKHHLLEDSVKLCTEYNPNARTTGTQVREFFQRLLNLNKNTRFVKRVVAKLTHLDETYTSAPDFTSDDLPKKSLTVFMQNDATKHVLNGRWTDPAICKLVI